MWSCFFYYDTSEPESAENIVKTLSHTDTAPKALGVKFHFP